MNKTQAVRHVLKRGTGMFTADIAREVGCTQPLVFQVIRAMKQEGELFDEQQVVRQVSYRLLQGDEAAEQRAARKRLEEERQRRAEIKGVRDQLTAARRTIDEALQRLATLAAN